MEMLIDREAWMAELGPSWYVELADEIEQPYFTALQDFIAGERAAGKEVFPPKDQVFHALTACPFNKVRVVVVGQDPYHGPGQAHGLGFSVTRGTRIPPSLRNIYKELAEDLRVPPAEHGYLEHWAHQGVLLLNATLTVERAKPASHHGRGWERFTDAVIQRLWTRKEPVVFFLWGRNAQQKCDTIMTQTPGVQHKVLTAAHPSPFSAHNGFFGCRHFSQANHFLLEQNLPPINWALPA